MVIESGVLESNILESSTEKQWLRCLVVDQMKIIKKMQVKWKSMCLASHYYQQEKPTKESDE